MNFMGADTSDGAYKSPRRKLVQEAMRGDYFNHRDIAVTNWL